MNMREKFYTRNEIMNYLGVSPTTLWRMMSEDLEYIKLRGRVLFDKEKVKQYLIERTKNEFSK